MSENQAGVVGYPVLHSLSPVIHNAGYRALGLSNWHYNYYEVPENSFFDFMEHLPKQIRGLSVTMPHKLNAFAVANRYSAAAKLSQVANTLIWEADGWFADNTDIYGITEALAKPIKDSFGVTGELFKSMTADLHGAIIGSGATAKSAVLAFRDLGIRELQIYARNREKASQLVDFGQELALEITIKPLTEWDLGNAEIQVLTLPPGHGVIPKDEKLRKLSTTANAINKKPRILLDIVYQNWPTEVAKLAKESGVLVVNGLEMLVYQAAKQFELMTGKPAPVAEMFAAVATAKKQ